MPLLGEGGYDMKDFVAPAATGTKLQVLAWILGQWKGGRIIRRAFINSNHPETLRQLSLQVDKRIPSLGMPMQRLDDEDFDAARRYAREEHAQLAENPTQYLSQLDSSKYPYNTIEDYHRAYLSGRTPTQVITRVLSAVAELNPTIKAIQDLLPESEIMAMAKASDKRYAEGKPLSMLDGVPFTIKDEVHVKGLPNMYGTNPNNRLPGAAKVEEDNDPVVQALLDAGAILLGTNTMHEYGVSPLGYNTWYQGPLNAFNTSYFTGGSSSGSATAVAAGLVPFAIGFDGGGSIRIPSSWSGVVGLAPTFGRVNFEIPSTSVFTVLHCGPIAATVADAAHVLRVIGNTKHEVPHIYDRLYGPDGRPAVHLHALTSPETNHKPTVGIFQDWVRHSDPEVYNAFEKSLTALDWNIYNFTMPNMGAQSLSHMLTITAEFGKELDYEDISRLEPGTKIEFGLGRDITAVERLTMERLKGWSMEQWNAVFEKVDAIVTPTLPITSIPIPEDTRAHGMSNTTLFVQMMRYVWPTNFLGFPAITVPVDYDSKGMPIGLLVMCPQWKDDKCLALAEQVEKIVANERRRPSKNWVDVLAGN
ncbi:conserved hypothetical protein [Perkinsus marinus ATCC 50983]|uniref:Amidase domain-containing protein n=1 Tax=Perkinsus marinus (strain ATCC 50983 / TXsc) TaxID=423536 RepID=C5LS65_PERM5|nr:conserved hypothetical protein [Perkinsus marinus ATCC 50983]EER00427.1 conserved hypothetical protein [Perkinsus marinus ATCC 50983]|eukprot:XP_002767709.1 conserved hypothetical protein [Perkinsus marinus ATCC 50983]